MTQRFSLFLFSAESYFADKDVVLLPSLRVAICHQVQKLFCFQVSNAFIIIRQDFPQVRFKKTQSTRQPGMQTTQVRGFEYEAKNFFNYLVLIFTICICSHIHIIAKWKMFVLTSHVCGSSTWTLSFEKLAFISSRSFRGLKSSTSRKILLLLGLDLQHQKF